MSSWSEIRQNSSDAISGSIDNLLIKINQNEAISDQLTISDKITPIKIVKSKLKIHDRNMTTGYARSITPDTIYYTPFEPDGKKLRMDIKFDSGGNELKDHSFMGNMVEIGYIDTQPELLKNTDDDGITAGEISTLLDGQQHYYYSDVNNHNSVKKMIQDGETGITIVYRLYPLKVENEFNNSKRAVIFYYVENDQVEYGIKAEITDLGIIYFYFKYGSTTYWAYTTTAQIVGRDFADFRAENYDPENFQTEDNFSLNYPIAYQDMAFSFNFSTKERKIFNNGVQQTLITGSTPLTPSPFPPAFTDPPPPDPIPVPYIQPYTSVYNQTNETASVKINSSSVSDQSVIYNIPGSDPNTSPVVLKYNINPGTQTPPNPAISLGGVDTTDDSWIPLCKDTTNSNNCTIAAFQILNVSSGLGLALNTKVINSATFWVQGIGSPAGTFFCRMWDGAGNVVHTFGSQSATTLTTATQAVTFQDSANTTPVATGYRIGLEYTQGAVDDIIKVQRNMTDKDPSVAQSVVHPGQTAFSNNTTYDVRCSFSSGAGTAGALPYLQISNVSGGTGGTGEYFRTGAPMVGVIPTLIELKVFRDSASTTNGTITLKHLDATLNTKAILATAAVSTLPTSDTGTYNFTWQNVDYNLPIQANDSIVMECTGVTSGFIYVLNNYNNTINNDYDGTNSAWIYKKNSDGKYYYNTDLDLSGRISSGGATFTGFMLLDDTRKRLGIKADNAPSVILGQKITKVTVPLKDFGNPSLGNIYCRIRDKTGAVKANLGFIETAVVTSTEKNYEFENTQNTYAIQLDDTISIEYDSGTATDAIQVRVATESIESSNTTLFESVISNLNVTTPVNLRDLAATIFIGGAVDTSARPIRGVKVNTAQSILVGKAITEVRVKLKATTNGIIPGVGGLVTGTVFVKCWIVDHTTSGIVSELGTIDFTTISTTAFTEYIFQNPTNTYALKVGDRIDITFDDGDFANYIELKVSATDVLDGSNTIMFEKDSNNVFYDVQGQDMTGSMYIGGYLVTPDPGTPTPPIPYHYVHAWYVSASIPPDSGALVDPDTLKPDSGTFLNNVSKQFRLYSMVLTADQLSNYYNNRWTITPIPHGRIEVVGHDIVAFE
jgi:hypothetical protein